MKARWFALLNYRHPEMAVHVVMRITFLLLLTSYELAEAAAPIAKPNYRLLLELLVQNCLQ